MQYQTIFFDLDDTLYDKGTGVWSACRERIEMYMHERVGMPLEAIPAIRQSYLNEFGTTLRGLYVNHQIDPDEYLVYVHDLPIEEMIVANPALGELLGRLPQRKWVFTNASLAHARRVLAALGVSEQFEEILDIKAMGYRSKPNAAAYQIALQSSGQSAVGSLFVDDQGVNLEPAKKLGAGTVLVSDNGPHPAADQTIERVEDLLAVMPALVE